MIFPPLRSRAFLAFSLVFFIGIKGPFTDRALSQEMDLRVFARHQLTEKYFSEGIAVGDLNGDGINDVVYGPYWFAGPDFQSKFEIYSAVPQPKSVTLASGAMPISARIRKRAQWLSSSEYCTACGLSPCLRARAE